MDYNTKHDCINKEIEIIGNNNYNLGYNFTSILFGFGKGDIFISGGSH